MKTAFMAMLAWLGLLAGAVPAADPLAGAAWIRDERFQGHEVLGVFEAHQKKAKSTILQNIHSYFRKEFELSEEPARAQLCFSADDYAKLYVNGRFVVQGPEPSYPFAQPFCQIDVTGALRAGRNCLAAHAYYHGLACRAFNSADNRSGLIVRLEISFADGSTQTLVSDGTWNCFAAQTFSSDRTFGYATQFNEDIDLTKEPHGWRDVGFVDEAWPKAVAARQDHEFVKQITPPLDHWRADPVTFEEKEPGRWFVDFGIEVAGHTRIRVKGARGHVMTVWHGEELSAPKTVRHDMRCNCDYVDKITLSGADDLVEFYDYRGFRYIELIDAPGKPQVWVDVRHHPFDWEATHFASSNETLNRIWEISKRAVQMGCQGVFVDCPTREKGQYTGDAYLTIVSQLLLTADATLAKKAILDWRLSQRFDPGMLCVAPGGFRQELAEWSLLWPV
ncbi:MAG: family 78 glycoside hydrolase catalytic domain, partial [Pirellulaceae bacterium]|nr:family 78 glycoside hydrolase catalytic domain [Pirellulaceae bacterium]